MLISGRDDTNDRDRTLMALIARRDESAFREIHCRYERRIGRFVSKLTEHPELVGEITNDTLWIVWRSAAQFKGASKVSTWIMGIAYHVGVQAVRRMRLRAQGCVDSPAEAEADDPWSESESREWIARGLAQLPVSQRTALERAYYLGQSCEEISKVENCSVNTIKTRLFYGRRRLKVLLPRLAGRQWAQLSGRCDWNDRRYSLLTVRNTDG